jgi:hypothetical protein
MTPDIPQGRVDALCGMGGALHDPERRSIEWFTPPHIFAKLLLTFDLDPCAPAGGVPWIPARRHFSIEDDGLAQEWHGRVWLSFHRGLMRGPLRIFCTECFLKGILARRVYSPHAGPVPLPPVPEERPRRPAAREAVTVKRIMDMTQGEIEAAGVRDHERRLAEYEREQDRLAAEQER